MLQLHAQHKSIKRNVIEIIVSYNSYRLVETYNMVFKFVLFASLAAFATAGYIGAPAQLTYGAPSAQIAYASPAYTQYAAPAIAKLATPVLAKTEEYDAHPQYSYGYNIEDALTGDSKNQQESRDGDVVQGSYSLTDPDGTRRTVQYTADPINGFNAVVHKEPLVAKTVVAAPAYAKVAAPLAYAAPAYTKLAAPLGYASPLGYSGNLGYGAPLTKYY